MQTLKGLARRRGDDEKGFTLIELMVVVLIIAILIAIAIPTFLGARARAQDRAAQSDLRNGLTAEKTVYTDNQTYINDVTTAGLKGVEPSLKWGTVAASDLTVTLSTDKLSVCLSQVSKSGTTFSLLDIGQGSSAGTYYGKVACSTPADMNGAVLTGFTGSW